MYEIYLFFKSISCVVRAKDSPTLKPVYICNKYTFLYLNSSIGLSTSQLVKASCSSTVNACTTLFSLLLFGWFTLACLIINETRNILENLIDVGIKVPNFLAKGLDAYDKLIESKTNKNDEN